MAEPLGDAQVISLAGRLKARREELGLSQAQAARELDVARTAYRLWEMEAARPAPDRWRLIARWLGVSVATMLLSSDLMDPAEAGAADSIVGRLEPGPGQEAEARPGDFFEQEVATIARASERGLVSGTEAADLVGVLDRVRSTVGASVPTRSWRPAEFRKDLAWSPLAPASARAALLVAAAGVPPGLLDDAELMTSELVTNSVQHTAREAGDIGIHINVGPDHLRVEVTDGGTRPARPRSPDLKGGWGLNVVMALAARWGAGQAHGRNVTWFELDLPQPGSHG